MYQTANAITLIAKILEALNEQYSIQQILESLIEMLAIRAYKACSRDIYQQKQLTQLLILDEAAKMFLEIK